MATPSFSLVLPCYNEELSLPDLVKRVEVIVRERMLSTDQFQLILVENGSKDQSLAVMQNLKTSAFGSYLQIVKVHPNLGYGNGVFQGLETVKTEYAAWTHADEQCDPADAFRALDKILQSKNPQNVLVKGRRIQRDPKDAFISKGFEYVAKLILWNNLTEINAQPKVFSARLIPALVSPPLDFSFDLYVLLKAKESGFAFQEVVVEFPPRKHGVSNWAGTFKSKYKTILKMVRYMLAYRLGLR